MFTIDLYEFAAAVNDYSDALSVQHNHAVALYNRALADARLGRSKEAEDDRRRALELDPTLVAGEP